MIRTLLRRGIRRFERRYQYDATYMHQILETSMGAALRLSALSLFAQYRGPKAGEMVWAGAALASTFEGDCGPCVQLVVNMALEAGVSQDHLALCLSGRPEEAGDLGLGFRFAGAAINDGPDLDHLRDEIKRRFGPQTVVAVSYAASAGRVYPVLKRGLGFGHVCSKVQIGQREIGVVHRA